MAHDIMNCGHPEDIEIVAGNNHPPAMWQFLESENPDVPFRLDNSDFYLTISWTGSGSPIKRDSVTNASEFTIDLVQSIVAWKYSLADSRALPHGRLASYELERRIADGSQETLIGGHVVVSGGLTDD